MKVSFLIMAFLLSIQGFAFGQFFPVAKVIAIKGSALINDQKLKVGDEIATGTVINIKAPADYVDVAYPNGKQLRNIVRLKGANVTFTELTPKKSIIDVIRGKVFSIVNHLTPNEVFEIHSKQVSFGVRGTKFMVDIDEVKEQSYVCVCDGVVLAKSEDGKEASVEKFQDLTVSQKSISFKAQGAKANMIKTATEEFAKMKQK
jgi:hypothetical protein